MIRPLVSRYAATLMRVPLLIGALAGCSTAATRFDETAAGLGFNRQTVLGTQFHHAVFFKPGHDARARLHVYLDGDGSPWIGGRRIADDPTPRDPLALRLMESDPYSSVYIGRPCYHGLGESTCQRTLWTSARYSETVVASMAQAITRFSARYGTPDLVLIGYSGGGTLAMLIAERLPNVRAVITLAANLDVDAWIRLHGYLALTGSLNPVRSAPLASDIFQTHYAGELDKNVPPRIVAAITANQPDANVRILPGFDHTCCWVEQWPGILEGLEYLDFTGP